MIVAPLVNILVRTMGTKFTMFLGTVSVSGGLIAASFAKQFWQLVITQGIMIGTGVGLMYVTTVPVVSQWFQRRRSFAQGITAGGTGIGGLIFSSSITPMIENLSLAWSLRIMGIICFIMLSIASIIVRDRNEEVRPSQHPFDVKFFRRLEIWLVLVWCFLSLLGYMTLISTLPDFSRSLGVAASQSRITAILINLTTTSGRTLAGLASDHWGRITVPLICTLASGILCIALWLPSQSIAPTLVFAFLVGNVYSVMWIVSLQPSPSLLWVFLIQSIDSNAKKSVAPILAELVGLQELPSVLAIVWLNAVVPCFSTKTPLLIYLFVRLLTLY